jgi:hypothetical protein
VSPVVLPRDRGALADLTPAESTASKDAIVAVVVVVANTEAIQATLLLSKRASVCFYRIVVSCMILCARHGRHFLERSEVCPRSTSERHQWVCTSSVSFLVVYILGRD